MKNKYWGKKAEDILTDDSLVKEIRDDKSLDVGYVEEYNQSKAILETLSKKEYTLTHSEKVLLGKRISQTIGIAKRRILIIRISAAAVLFLIVGIASLLMISTDPEIKAFALNNQQTVWGGNTRLILSGEEEIQIKSDESKIAYEGNGQKIQVDSNVVRQIVDEDKMIYNTVIVPYGKRTRITLSDNSSVWVNSGSKFVYPACFAKDKREVYLEGEAIFEVSHNKQRPFHVITRDVEVKVLGTVFDLSAYTEDSTTATILESGSVEMKYNTSSILNSSKLVMNPGMMAVYNQMGNEITQSKVNTRFYTSWKDGYIDCEKQSLGEILKKVSRHYNVSIQMNDKTLADETFTGKLDFRNSAVQVLSIIAEFISVKVENVDNQIQITRI